MDREGRIALAKKENLFFDRFGILYLCSIILFRREPSLKCPKMAPRTLQKGIQGGGFAHAHIPLKNPPSHEGIREDVDSHCAILVILTAVIFSTVRFATNATTVSQGDLSQDELRLAE